LIDHWNRKQIRRLIELRAQERAAGSALNLTLFDPVFMNFLGHARQFHARSRSRHLTDLVASFFLGREKRFLEIGAAYPEVGSDTFLLETEFNWTGVQLEPNPNLAQQLIEVRNSTVLNSALIGKERQGRNLFLNFEKGTLNFNRGFKVSTQTLEQVVEKFGTNFQACFIDIEGGEPEIIGDQLFGKIPFDFIAIERIWNYELICKRLECLGFINIFSEISGYESWWLSTRLFHETFQS
jgi:hypothetical protein